LTELADEIGSVESALDRLADTLRAQGADAALAREAQRARSVLRRRVRELHAGLLDARMAPLSEPFARVADVLRELAVERGRRVRLVTRGGETRIDRALVDRVGDAIVAVARDALERGGESGVSGAPDTTLRIDARVQGVVLRVEVAHVGAARGPGVARGDQGLDRARAVLHSAGGTVTRTADEIVVLEVPVAVVRVPVLLFEARGHLFAVARDAVRRVRAFTEGELSQERGRIVLRDGDEALPLVWVADVLGVHAAPRAAATLESRASDARDSTAHAFVLDGPRGAWVLAGDRLLGGEDVVVSAFGPSLCGVPMLAGAADLGQDRIALVIDTTASLDETSGTWRSRASVRPLRVEMRVPVGAKSSAGGWLVVEVRAKRHALSLSFVREVIATARVTRVPRAPVGVAGVIAWHGAFLTVVDLAWLVNGRASALAEGAPVVLVDLGQETVGLCVERVVRVARDLSADGAEPVDPVRLFVERAGA
jgi:two-component system chemotaxis sensor kinase CheA